MIAYVEMTDTFGGEANYSWVKRATVSAEGSDLAVVRRAKKAIGLNGVKCRRSDFGDGIELRPACGACLVVFITFGE